MEHHTTDSFHNKDLQNNLIDIKSIVQFGTRVPEDYTILFYKEIYGKEVVVRIRGLSNYEYDEISLEMYEHIKDANTIKYIFGEYADNDVLDKELPKDVNLVEYTKAITKRNALIVYHAMKDFYPNLTFEDVKQMEGIDEVAKRVNEKSGRTEEIIKKIQFFREQQSKLDT